MLPTAPCEAVTSSDKVAPSAWTFSTTCACIRMVWWYALIELRQRVRASATNRSVVTAASYCSGNCCRKRSEEHTSELQSLMRISYAVFCLKKKTTNKQL